MSGLYPEILPVSRACLADCRPASRPLPPLLGGLLVEGSWWFAGPWWLQLQPSQACCKHLYSRQRRAVLVVDRGAAAVVLLQVSQRQAPGQQAEGLSEKASPGNKTSAAAAFHTQRQQRGQQVQGPCHGFESRHSAWQSRSCLSQPWSNHRHSRQRRPPTHKHCNQELKEDAVA